MTKKQKILWAVTAAYFLLLIVITLVTINDFTRLNFGLLFIVITLWPIGRYFLLRYPPVSAWLNGLKH